MQETDLPEIRIRLTSQSAIRADDYGDLISALASDYRKVNPGRELVVVRVETGSLITVLTDLANAVKGIVEVAKPALDGALAVATFVKKIRDLVASSRQGKKTVRPRSIGSATLKAIVKMGIDSGANFELRHKSPSGEILEVTVSANDAQDIGAAIAPIRSSKLAPELEAPSEATASFSRVAALRHSLTALESLPPTSEFDTLLDALVAVMFQEGQQVALARLAKDMEELGFRRVSNGLRNRIREAEGRRPPKS